MIKDSSTLKMNRYFTLFHTSTCNESFFFIFGFSERKTLNVRIFKFQRKLLIRFLSEKRKEEEKLISHLCFFVVIKKKGFFEIDRFVSINAHTSY